MLNRWTGIGNVGRDPEVRHLDGNRSVANFTLATTESYRDKSGELVSNTTWHNIVCWSSLAILAEKYIRKGRQLYVEGKITNRQYDDKDGNKKFISEIIADNIRLLGKKEETSSGYQEPQPTGTQEDSDLPF